MKSFLRIAARVASQPVLAAQEEVIELPGDDVLSGSGESTPVQMLDLLEQNGGSVPLQTFKTQFGEQETKSGLEVLKWSGLVTVEDGVVTEIPQ